MGKTCEIHGVRVCVCARFSEGFTELVLFWANVWFWLRTVEQIVFREGVLEKAEGFIQHFPAQLQQRLVVGVVLVHR